MIGDNDFAMNVCAVRPRRGSHSHVGRVKVDGHLNPQTNATMHGSGVIKPNVQDDHHDDLDGHGGLDGQGGQDSQRS
jgi:hypothetical protein